MEIPTITTAQLVLRPLVKKDAAPFHRAFSDRDVLRYFPNTNPPSLEQIEKMIAGQWRHWTKYRYGWWAVEPQTENKFIGWCGLQYLPDTKETEVAYMLDKNYWGRGWATEGARASLKYGFEELALESIVGIVHTENIASQRVLEKAGLAFVEEAEYFGMDCYRYVLDRSEYGRASQTQHHV